MIALIEASRGEKEVEIDYGDMIVKFQHGQYKLTAEGLESTN